MIKEGNENRLTKFVKAAGCAAKLGPGDLDGILQNLTTKSPNLIVGVDSSDDAAVWKISDDKAMVQTVDFITPVVDDPFVYGQVAAANSLSDIFAMGADVATALNLVGFDGCNQSPKVLNEILAGGASKVKECGGVIVGGHSIETVEMIYGLSVTGFANPNKIYRNDTPKIGDMLILCKPLGLGILTTAIKADLLSKSAIDMVSNILSQLNYRASLAMREFRVNACTDITGFGLAGHAWEMSGKGRVSLRFEYDKLPILDESIEMANMGIIPDGAYRNKTYLSDKTLWRSDRDDIIFYDAQTSGGLLMAVDEKDAKALLDRLIDEGYEYSSIIGEVLPLKDKALIVE